MLLSCHDAGQRGNSDNVPNFNAAFFLSFFLLKRANAANDVITLHLQTSDSIDATLRQTMIARCQEEGGRKGHLD